MALSEEEQRLLAQMEAALSQEDPRLASTLRGTPTLSINKGRFVLGVVGVVVGLAALVGGISVHPVVSVIGFAIMLGASVVAIMSMRFRAGHPQPPMTDEGVNAGSGRGPQGRFMDKMEEQWRKRMEDGTS